MNVIQLLEKNAQQLPNKTALSFRNGNEIEIISWSNFWKLVCQTANGLHT